MFGLGRKDTAQQSGQQRRAKANREAARAGDAAMDAKIRRQTALETHPVRAWWRSS